MEQRISLVTLGVADLARARTFYEALGWVGQEVEETVFFQAGDHAVVLWDRQKLADDAAVTDEGDRGFGGITLAHLVRSPAAVDELVDAAERAGAVVTKRPATTFYGGYAGYVADPDGHLWEVAHNPGFTLRPDGALRLPDFSATTSVDAELRGERVVLREPDERDLDALTALFAEPEIARRWPLDGRDRVEADLLRRDDKTVYAIEVGGDVVGVIQSWEEDDADYRHAGMDIAVATRFHGTGVAVDALRTLARHLLDVEGHHRLVIDPAADNDRAIACYRKVGFRPVGVMRRYERGPDGTFHDGLLMELLADDSPPRRPPVRGRLAASSTAPDVGERTEVLAETPLVTVEHVLSGRLDDAVAYRQDHDEWVVVVEGSAELDVDGERHELTAGDWLLLPEGTPHRLLRTAPGTRWLAVRVRSGG
jgi:hypothetical protein